MKIRWIAIVAVLFGTLSYTKEDQKRLVWSDEFNSSGAPDSTKWSYDLGDGCPRNCGWGNHELEFYTHDLKNVRVENGRLIIEALKDSLHSKPFTSTRMVSKGKGDWLYGRIEIKARLPRGKGTWPAIWMLSTDWKYGGWPASGEIDIMEHVGFDPGVIHGTIHTEAFNHRKGTQKGVRSYKMIAWISFMFTRWTGRQAKLTLSWMTRCIIPLRIKEAIRTKNGHLIRNFI
jgi:beta-glucanase (GH16 family)